MSYCNMPVITRTIRVICTPPKLSGNRRILLFEMRRLRDWAVDLVSSIIGAICRRRVLPPYQCTRQVLTCAQWFKLAYDNDVSLF